MTRQALVALITLSISGVGVAEAEEQCRELLAPPALSLRDIGFDQSRAACAADTIGIGARAFASTEDKSTGELLSASLFFDYRILHASGFEFGIGARVVDYRFAPAGATTSDEVFAGPLHIDVLRPDKRNWFGKPLVLSHAIRLDLPFTNTADDDFTISISPSILASVFLSESTHLHGRVAGLLWSTLPDSGADSRAALLSSLDLAYSPLSPVSLLVGTQVQGGWYGRKLDHVQARAGLRMWAGKFAAIELSTGTSLFGKERADIVTWVGYRRSVVPTNKNKPSRLQDWAR